MNALVSYIALARDPKMINYTSLCSTNHYIEAKSNVKTLHIKVQFIRYSVFLLRVVAMKGLLE